jgi:penicillin-binding protein 1A
VVNHLKTTTLKIFTRFGKYLIGFCISGHSFSAVLVGSYILSAPKLTEEDLTATVSSKIYDKTAN